MICKNIKTNILYNYFFDNYNRVMINDGFESITVNYKDWCKDFYVVDKLKSLSELDKQYNNRIKNSYKNEFKG